MPSIRQWKRSTEYVSKRAVNAVNAVSGEVGARAASESLVPDVPELGSIGLSWSDTRHALSMCWPPSVASPTHAMHAILL